MTAYLYRWANPHRANSMATPGELLAEGYEDTGKRDSRYPASVLMRKEAGGDHAAA